MLTPRNLDSCVTIPDQRTVFMNSTAYPDVSMLESLPETPLKQQTLMSLGDQTDDTTTILPVAGCETDGSILSNLILAFYFNTGTRRVIVGFDGTGWQPIEETSASTPFTTDEDDLFAWFDTQKTYNWLAANGVDLDARISVYETNKSDAPEFLRETPETPD